MRNIDSHAIRTAQNFVVHSVRKLVIWAGYMLALDRPHELASAMPSFAPEVAYPEDGVKASPKICYLADARSPLVHRWLSHAVRRGWEVHIFSVDPLSVPMEGVTAHRIPPNRWPFFSSRMMRYLSGALTVRRRIAQIRPDLVHVHYAWGYGLLGTLCTRVPLIVSIWGSDLLVTAAASHMHSRVMSFVLRRADHICATSDHLRAEAARYTSKPIVRTPFGVDCERFRPRGRPDARIPVLGMVKRLDQNSGVEILIRAHALLAAAQHPSRLLLVGETLGTRWNDLAHELGFRHLIEFRGHTDAERIHYVYNEMDIYVQPTIQTEGFGVAVLEAESSGLPVIASHLGGLPEVVQDDISGLLVSPGNVSELARTIGRLIDEPLLRKSMGEAGREFVVEHYGANRTYAIMDDLYSRALFGGQQ